MSDLQTDQLLKRVHDTIYATIYGTLAVARVQGLLGGLLLFGAAGFILGPVILTITMVLLESWADRGRGGVDVNQASDGPDSAT